MSDSDSRGSRSPSSSRSASRSRSRSPSRGSSRSRSRRSSRSHSKGNEAEQDKSDDRLNEDTEKEKEGEEGELEDGELDDDDDEPEAQEQGKSQDKEVEEEEAQDRLDLASEPRSDAEPLSDAQQPRSERETRRERKRRRRSPMRDDSDDFSGPNEEFDEFGRVIQVGGAAAPKKVKAAKDDREKDQVKKPRTVAKSIGIQTDFEAVDSSDNKTEALEQEVNKQRLQLQIFSQRLAEEKRRRKLAQSQQQEARAEWTKELSECESVNRGLQKEVNSMEGVMAKILAKWRVLQKTQ